MRDPAGRRTFLHKLVRGVDIGRDLLRRRQGGYPPAGEDGSPRWEHPPAHGHPSSNLALTRE